MFYSFHRLLLISLIVQTSLLQYLDLMQEDKDYFILDESSIIQGTCTQFISQKEKQWRCVDKLQQPPYKRVAAHTRNIEYKPQNTRTFSTLKNTLKYLMDTIFPLLFQPDTSSRQRQRIVLFLEERLLAIRTEYFVQGIICPRELLKLIRCFVVVWLLKGMTSGSSPLIGLQLLVQNEAQEIMEKQFPYEYHQALKYAILNAQKKELHRFLVNRPIIFENQELYKVLLLKLKVESKNFYTYYDALENAEPIIRCILWLQIEQFKNDFHSIARKALGDVPTEWFYRRLCLQNNTQHKWITAKKAEAEGLPQIGYQSWIGLETVKLLV